MIGDTNIDPSILPPPPTATTDDSSHLPDSPYAPIPPVTPSYVPKRHFSLLPLIFGFFFVIFVSATLGVIYYKNKLVATPTVSPSPTPVVVSSPLPSPSLLASALPSASVTTLKSPSPKPSSTATPKPTVKPTATPTPTPTPSPTPTPVPQPTLDIRFGNPSGSVKQTYDDGSGAGRVINREYSSIQAGVFDEIKSSWSPRVTPCFQIVANEVVSGKDIKLVFSVDGKTIKEDVLSQYDKLEAGRLYAWCHDTTLDLGKHTAKLTLNGDKSLKETNYANSIASISYENIADNVAPDFTLMGPVNEGGNGTCLFPQYVSDNVNSYSELKIEQKVDSANWTKFEGDRTCITGNSGEELTFSIRITDARGNTSSQSKTFTLY